MITCVLLMAVLTTRLFPDTPASQWFTHYLVVEPLRIAAQIERRHLIMLGVMLFLFTAGSEILLLLGSWDMAVFYALDTSLFIDTLIATWTIATVTRGQRVWSVVKARLAGRPRPKVRAHRTKKASLRQPSANDDDRPAGVPLAA